LPESAALKDVFEKQCERFDIYNIKSHVDPQGRIVAIDLYMEAGENVHATLVEINAIARKTTGDDADIEVFALTEDSVQSIHL
jgi:hypothetical protein